MLPNPTIGLMGNRRKHHELPPSFSRGRRGATPVIITVTKT
jgi:hypothetical protein